MRTRLAMSIVAAVLTATTAACTSTSAPPAATPPAQAGSSRFTTPDEAAQAFLRALGTGDARQACRTMAAGGQVVETQAQAMEMCVAVMTQTADAAQSAFGAQVATATVTGATTSGDRADFAGAAVEPAEAASMITSMKAVRIGGSWYITGE